MTNYSEHTAGISSVTEAIFRLHDRSPDQTLPKHPNAERIRSVTQELTNIVLGREDMPTPTSVEQYAAHLKGKISAISTIFKEQIYLELASQTQNPDTLISQVEENLKNFLEALPHVIEAIRTDIAAALDNDPAALNADYVRLSYPGLFAIAVYRLANLLNKAGLPLIARIMTEFTHEKTGIDLHPGAQIGTHFFIDHGTGVVVGETAILGDHVALYQGVTLGAQSFPRNPDGSFNLKQRRHPEIGNNVKIYAGATVLGHHKIKDGTIIGSGARLVLKGDIPAQTTILAEEQALRMHTRSGAGQTTDKSTKQA